MQLGTRWTAGGEPPASVPPVLRAAIAEVERDQPAGGPGARWTLTFLEGRPIADLDTGVTLSLRADGTVAVRRDDDPEDEDQA